ncbi:MAG: nucleoside triphosphate pyrophosphohydrolase [Candidatus Cloacimonetes bacterium]|nr:nucleoside triphosphate pyrophosphohydrolase [Candidatus Cloacimonadota bacterium]
MKEFDKLLEIMNKLRNPENGCPWDIEQTLESLRPHMIEEVYEISDAISQKNYDALKEELGDLLLHIVFQAKIAEEDKQFNIEDVLKEINKKMILRHPHIFENTKVKNADEVEHNWEKIKKKEKTQRKSILEGLPKSLPSLIKAKRIQSKAATVSFDWNNVEDIFKKFKEELAEFELEYKSQNQKKMSEELGDILFTLVNIARKLKIDPEFALENTIKKFIKRFNYIEENLKEKIFTSSLEKMEYFWQKAKENTDEE